MIGEAENMEKKLVLFDMNDVLTKENLAAKLTRYRPEALTIFKLYKEGKVDDRYIVVEGSKLYRGLPRELIEKEAAAIAPIISSIDLPDWEVAIISLDYMELVERIAGILKVQRRYGNTIIYENELHSGKVREPIVTREQKKVIVRDLKREMSPGITVGIDNDPDSPFKEVCSRVFRVSNEDELKETLVELKKM